MASWFRHDARTFGIVLVIFNILIAVFNILNYRVTSRSSVPCFVIVSPTSSSTEQAVESRIQPLAQLKPPTNQIVYAKSAATAEYHSSSVVSSPIPSVATTTLHTRVLSSSNKTTVSIVNTNQFNTTWDFEERSKYLVVKNYIPAENDAPRFNESVTLCTQGTFEFLDHVQMLCKRWDGPISVSVYAPGTDLAVAVRKIVFLRLCGPSCVRTNVSWHLIYDGVMGPSAAELLPPNEAAELDVYGPINCTAGEYPLDLTSEIRKAKKIPYPINVARNVARLQAKTKYVLASDIELYPNLNVVSRFMKLLSQETQERSKAKHVYTLPIFEVKKDIPVPQTKTELARRVKDGQAIFFHKWICDSCQSFPKRDEWLKFIPENDSLNVFFVTKRQHPRTAWEPIYIGTNTEPLYDERLTWEGKRDKMSQMYELCLLDYDFYILDNAFLVHAPGIKTMNRLEQQKRAPFMMKNNAIHNRLLAEMRKKYGARKGC